MAAARRFRWLRRLALIVVTVLLALLAGGWWLLSGSRAQLDGTRHVAALTHAVTIQRDALGTATLTGQSRDDLDFALGYVHAQERFFEMDLMRRLAAGELSALLGPAALKVDIDHRRHRLRAVAEAAYARLPPASQRALQLYSAGVNAGLAALRVRPWEYLLLRTKPRPWKPVDSLLVIAAMYLDLNSDGRDLRELRIAQMRAVLPASVVDFLTAPDPTWEAPLQGGLSIPPYPASASVFDLHHTTTPAHTTSAQMTELAAALAPAVNTNRPGSNNFAVGGRLTQSGAAALANDMHLTLRVPDIWFRTQLRYPDPTAPNGQRDVVGVSLPGTPAMVVGSNGQIAWGFTNSYGDWLDWVRVQRDPYDPSRYKAPGGWANLHVHDEIIRIKGAKPYTLKVEDTRWGPIMGTDVDGTPLALDWIAQHPHAYNLQLMRLEHAQTVKAALDLAPDFGIPPQNLLVADSAGHIGWTIAGNAIPLRHGFDPQRPADWSTPGTGWTGWAAAAQYPRIEDPADARLWTANNRTVGGKALALLGNGGYDLGARAQQIRADLHARLGFGPGNLLDIQLDDRAVFLTRWQGVLQRTLAGTRDPALAKLRQLTATWHEQAAPDSVDYRLVRAFHDQVVAYALAPFVARVQQRFPDFAWPHLVDPEAAVWSMIQRQPANLLNPRYSSWHALLVTAARHVAVTLGREPGGLAARTWGEVNRAQIDHPLSRALPGFLAHFLDMPHEPLPGDRDMPRVASPDFGASERFDVEPGHEAHGILEMPGGQSDNPLSPYYGAGQEDWVHGRPTPLLPGQTQHTLTLAPLH
ncbi:penicillin acylase family protein [Dyella sp. A6]|uniref:penicillin acylase family protein n=1 Tax=Dyella aluminiiresistens TaxID=3069105 RepID=UPI002E7A3CE6|nr:penicillin acylase family protein [Dyella sp. A6]